MRLWHWRLIGVLPREQLLGQWRECCLIAKNIFETGRPNHVLVNPIMDYPISHFKWYARLVYKEMQRRGYCVIWERFDQWSDQKGHLYPIGLDVLFKDWHTDRYLKQCFNNLEEKHDRGGIPDDEWSKVYTLCTCGRFSEEIK